MNDAPQTRPADDRAQAPRQRKPFVAPEVRSLGRMNERTLAGAGSQIDSNVSRGTKRRGIG
ncbi:MAG TPA: hypothetical protein VFW33_01420 [Gemmataceae bacterium]|nr:hypothetical protein [Gemmataceae bacterium]